MPWTMDDPPSVAENWTEEEKGKCVAAANAVLEEGGSEEDAIYACIHAAGRSTTDGASTDALDNGLNGLRKGGIMKDGMLFMRALKEEGEGIEDGGGPIRFVASTEGMKRDGMDLKVSQWRLDNYLRNPVVLWAHDYTGRNLPIGKTVGLTVAERRLVADILFDVADPFAQAVERKYRDGFLNAVSVGWADASEGKETALDLLDISAVPVPGDPDALMEREWRALREIYGLSREAAGEAEAGVDGPGDVEEAGTGGEAADEPEMGFSILEVGLRAVKLSMEIDKYLGGLK